MNTKDIKVGDEVKVEFNKDEIKIKTCEVCDSTGILNEVSGVPICWICNGIGTLIQKDKRN